MLLPSISGYFHTLEEVKNLELDKYHTVIALYIGLFSQSEENAPWIAEIFESYCPLYRAIFTIINIMIL